MQSPRGAREEDGRRQRPRSAPPRPDPRRWRAPRPGRLGALGLCALALACPSLSGAAAPEATTPGPAPDLAAASRPADAEDDAPTPAAPRPPTRAHPARAAAGDLLVDQPIATRPVAPPDIAAIAGPADRSKAEAVSDGDDSVGKLPARGKVKECCGYPVARPQDFRLSFYWLAYESEYAFEKYDTDIYTLQGFWIGRFPNAFVYELNLEGTGVLRDGRVLNYDGHCRYGVGTCFQALASDEHPLGRGVQARPLEPFRSIAVDPRYIPIGSPVFVPELVGVVLPDGTRHDGCLRADDQGGAIKLHKLDFFVESYFNFKFLADQLWWRLKATPHLDEPRCEYLRTYHPREHDNEYCDWRKIHSKSYARSLVAASRNKRHVLSASVGWRRPGKHGGRGTARGPVARRK